MNKKEAIQLSALQLLTTNGIHATPMSAIAKLAGTGMGTIYNYFPTKEVLLNEIYVDIKQKEENILPQFRPDQPIKTQFENYYMSVINFFIDNPLYFQFMDQLLASPIITEESRKAGYKAIDSVVQLLKKGQTERIIKNIEFDELSQFIGGTIMSYLRWYLSQEKTNTQSLSIQLQLVWDAIKE